MSDQKLATEKKCRHSPNGRHAQAECQPMNNWICRWCEEEVHEPEPAQDGADKVSDEVVDDLEDALFKVVMNDHHGHNAWLQKAAALIDSSLSKLRQQQSAAATAPQAADGVELPPIEDTFGLGLVPVADALRQRESQLRTALAQLAQAKKALKSRSHEEWKEKQALKSQVEELRKALIESGRAAGCLLADSVSTEFIIQGVPHEVKSRIAELEKGKCQTTTKYGSCLRK